MLVISDMNDLMAKLIQQQQNQRPNQVSAHVTTAASKPTTTPTLLNRAFTTTGTESEYERSLKKFVTEEMETELAVFRVNLDSQTKALKRRFEGFVMVAGRESKRVKEDVELGLVGIGFFLVASDGYYLLMRYHFFLISRLLPVNSASI